MSKVHSSKKAVLKITLKTRVPCLRGLVPKSSPLTCRHKTEYVNTAVEPVIDTKDAGKGSLIEK